MVQVKTMRTGKKPYAELCGNYAESLEIYKIIKMLNSQALLACPGPNPLYCRHILEMGHLLINLQKGDLGFNLCLGYAETMQNLCRPPIQQV